MKWYENATSSGDPRGLREQLKWQWAKDHINELLLELCGPIIPPSRSFVVLLSLAKADSCDPDYEDIMFQVCTRARVAEVTNIQDAIHFLQLQVEDAAVVVTDPALLDSQYAPVLDEVAAFGKAGGTVIFGLQVNEPHRMDDLQRVFRTYFGVPWQIELNDSTWFTLNDDFNAVFQGRTTCAAVPRQRFERAFNIMNAEPEDQVFMSNGRLSASPAVFAHHGEGFVGWIDDVGISFGTIRLLLAMCGIWSR